MTTSTHHYEAWVDELRADLDRAIAERDRALATVRLAESFIPLLDLNRYRHFKDARQETPR